MTALSHPDKLEEYRRDAKMDAMFEALETCPSCDHRSLMITASWRASLTEPAGGTGVCLCRQWYGENSRPRVPLPCEECRDLHLDNLAMFTVPAEPCDCACHCTCEAEVG